MAKTVACVAVGLLLFQPLSKQGAVRGQDAAPGDEVEFFEKQIRPVLVEHCLECHGDHEERSGGLQLDRRAGWQQGGDSGPAIVPGKPADSLLIRAIRYSDAELRMPPDRRLDDDVVADFERWVARGAVDPRDGTVAPRPQPGSDWETARQHWAYRLPARPDIPVVRSALWPINPIDQFILARIESAGLTPAPEADRVTLVRRLYFDLLGLPPTPDQIDAFLEDCGPDAYERLVDQLLASPHFGERWGRHWLDVTRFGESLTLRGFILGEAWRFRDYVIEAWNRDRPFDQLVREHIAGDLLPANSLAERQRQWVATTFLMLGNTNLEEQDKAQLRMDVVDEQLEVLGRAFLAQTIGCARCHDHKFDPIPTRDYYALAGILRNAKALEHANVSRWIEVPLPLPPEQEAVLREQESAIAALKARIKAQKELLASRDKTPDGTSPDTATAEELPRLESRLQELLANSVPRPLVMTVVEEPDIQDAPIHIRGSVHNLGDLVPRGFLQVAHYDPLPPMPSHASGRRELGDWLASPRNPLTARVFVNRAWHWLFGAGLVRTTDNFGTTGESPSHPELLDYLAVEFMEGGWSIKDCVRGIVLSRSYRLSSHGGEQVLALDPENRLLARAHRRRLDAECLRDATLVASGRLRLEMGGKTIRPGTKDDYGYVDQDTRRSVYLPVLRNSLPEWFEAFDFANPSMVVGRRDVSTVAPQALFMLNHPAVHEEATWGARRLLHDVAHEPQRLELAYRRTIGRPPRDSERRLCEQYLREASQRGWEAQQAWTQLVHALFASLDFRYVD